jgi:hypothetical protein
MPTKRHRIQVAITGGGVSPETVALRDLADVLARIDRTIRSYLASNALEISDDEMVSLVEIVEGSEGLVLAISESLIPVLGMLSKAVYDRDFSLLPRETYTELFQLSTSLAGRGWGLRFEESKALGIFPAVIDSSRPLAPPGRPISVEGTTTLYGRCLRVGGAGQPKAEVRLQNASKLLHIELSEVLAKELATKLYEEVALEGAATWDAESWEIQDFRVTRVTSFRRTDPAAVFRELAEAAKGRWDEVDASSYIHSLRSDPE